MASGVSFLGSLGVALLCAVISILPGFAVTRRVLRRRGGRAPERLALSAAVGTGLCLLVFGILSNVGVRGTVAGPLTLVLVGSGALLTLRGERPAAGVELRQALFSGPLPLIVLAGGMLALLPLLLYHSFDPYNDSYTYLGIAEYVHRNPFSRPADPDPFMPLYGVARLYQMRHLRMGATFFLAFIRALLPVERAISVYPGVVAWALMLNVLAVFLLCRWAARLRTGWSVVAAAIAALWPNSFHFAAAHGFFPQLFGTAFLAVALALLGRRPATRGTPWRWGILLGFTGACLAAAYSELLPFLALIAVVVFAVRIAVHPARRGATVRLALVAAAGLLVFANHELLRAVQAITAQMHVQAGGYVDMSGPERLANLYGLFAAPYWDRNFWRTLGPSRVWAFPVSAWAVAGVVVLGVVGLLRRPRARDVWLLGSLVFLAVTAYFAGVVHDPWRPSLRGHSWNLFKLAQWGYPIALVPLVAGLGGLHRAMSRWRPWPTALGILLAGVLVPTAGFVHAYEARYRTAAVRWDTRSERPFEELTAFSNAANRLVPGPVVCIQARGMGNRLRQMLVYYLYPRGVSSDWGNDSWIYPYLSETNRAMVAPCAHGIVTVADEATHVIAGLPADLVLSREDRSRPR